MLPLKISLLMEEITVPLKVGIPRALLYYYYYPLWRTFFTELGAEVVLSQPSNKGILEAGLQKAVDEVCFPVKLAYGHVLDLADKADLIFLPRLVSVAKREYVCPKFMGEALAEAAARGKLPKAVVIVNIFGQSADMDPLLELCNKYHVPVIEDAAESLGATYKGKPSGTMGKYGIFSFNGNKIITTAGGGMLVSNDIDGLAKARFWATQARDQARYYQHSELGFNYRLSNILAAIGRGQLKVLDERINARRAIFARYAAGFSDLPFITMMPEASFGRATRWLTVLTIDPDAAGVTAEQILEELQAENIEARPVWKPMHLQPLFTKSLYYPHAATSCSDYLFANGICLPSGSNMTEQDVDRVIEVVRHSVGY